MNKRKFTFLILDDEEENGYRRIPQNIIKKYVKVDENYLLEGSVNDITFLIGDDDRFTFFIEAIVGIRYFNNVTKSFKDVIDDLNLFLNSDTPIDAFFIDLKWDMGKKNNNDLIKFYTGTDISIEDKKPWENNNKIPYTIAGIKFLEYLKPDERPKIIFSGAEQTEWFTWLFSFMGKRVLTNDILIGNIKGTGDYINKINETLEIYFHKKQTEVCRSLSCEKTQELITRLGNAAEYDKYDIPDIDHEDYCWSLKSLFPKEINNLNDDNKNMIISLLEMDFRKTIVKLAKWHKPYVERIFDTHVKLLDMKAGTKDGQEIEYLSLEKLFENVNITKEAIVRAKLYNYNDVSNDGVNWVNEIEKRLSTQNYSINFLSQEHLVLHYGIYWGQLLYIARVAHINYTNYNNQSKINFEIDTTESNGNLSIKIDCGNCNGSDITTNTKTITFANNRIIDLNSITAENVGVLNSEKITDILKIVCYLWKSEFKLIYGDYEISFTWNFNEKKIKFTTKNNGNNGKQVSYIINVNKINVNEKEI